MTQEDGFKRASIFLQRRRRSRNKPFVTLRGVIGLIAVSVAAMLAFRVWVGNPDAGYCGTDCEGMHSLFAWVLGFAMIFVAVIGAGALAGIALSLLQRRRGTDPFSNLISEEDPSPSDRKDGTGGP
ncbi:hypothetical protein [Eilatimonas milleporae]|uniref:Uncharacterized protein n=1 Tax=Eilatimonas milleporae TaxID=911205 RepID=A0A3M0CHV2_9PROT|nr:hypothetical protein [Eilatimonas milleporae]RMB02813.1 hypothetical protein BXY39_3165 [Eilatimonas milleporae]